MSVWWTSYTGHLNTIGARVEQGICYELDQTYKVSNSTGLSIYARKMWLCYESIPLLVSDVPAQAQSPKPAQAGPGKLNQARAMFKALEGLLFGLRIYKAWAMGLSRGLEHQVECARICDH